jgi:glucosamine--fructose-6-phosphate aminotransferase (isomerizing)
MCGITACVSLEEILPDLLESLANLEYRGYDSAGIAIPAEDRVTVCKRAGEIGELVAAVAEQRLEGRVGIGHSRWSTHGPPSDANAHPHTDCTGRVAVVHNGIIDNYEELRSSLQERGHTFTSETDTEVVPHMVEDGLQSGLDVEAAFRETVEQLDGSYAIAMVVADEATVYAARSGSPLVLGLGDDANYLASDIPGFREHTDRVIYLEDGDIAVVGPTQIRIVDSDGQPLERLVKTVDWAPEDAEKSGYNHYMLKEIHEQPTALRQTIEGRTSFGDADTLLDSIDPDSFADIDRVVFVACGTSYHASIYGRTLLHRRGIPASADLANEFANEPRPTDERTLVVAVTQSGETADTVEALRKASNDGARTVALTNTVGSTAAREADDTLFIRAGPEIGVAATKTFSSQVTTLVLLAERLRHEMEGESPDAELLAELAGVPDQVERILGGQHFEQLAKAYQGVESHFFIGRGVGFPVALEGALKFKEITYAHAEGFAAGELKHGPLALVTEDSLVVAVIPNATDEKTLHNINEVRTRGAKVIVVAPESMTEAARLANDTVWIPDGSPELTAINANVVLQLLSYHAAELRGRPIDKPRNLAKSVTVE